MKFSITASSRTGCVRANNEDMVLVDQWFIRNGKMSAHIDTSSVDRYLIALADGMGGHSSGEVASSEALHNLQFFFSDLPVGLSISDFNEAIYEWLSSINNIIDSKGRCEERLSKMGTTLVAFAYYGGRFYWMNCGDSRIYRFHNDELSQLSTDHSLSSLMGDSEHTNIITNCIGGGCKSSYMDIVEFTADVQRDDVYLLCSDGLSNMLTDEQIRQYLERDCNADMLCFAAEQAGGHDNVSAIVVKVQ